jgi:hypothetical protein
MSRVPSWFGAIGVMFTVAGQNDIRAIYPNISFKYFFEQP